MSDITKNPPLAAYFAAGIGKIFGWSEISLHFGFLLPTLFLVFGTYRLAQRFTTSPLTAAMATLLTPGILVSATSVMCDTLMLALWVWAVLLWMEGVDKDNSSYLLLSSVLAAACGLTKYFGITLIPLFLVYCLLRRPARSRLWFLFIPIAVLALYQVLTSRYYGLGLLLDAAAFSQAERGTTGLGSRWAATLVGLSFSGGCTLSLLFAPWVWRWNRVALFGVLGAFSGFAITGRWLSLAKTPLAAYVEAALSQHWISLGAQLSFFIAGGISVISLAVVVGWRAKNADATFLCLWVVGTFIFAAFLNWTVNARSVLPIIPAAGILLATQLSNAPSSGKLQFSGAKVILPLVLSAVISILVARADAQWANTQRRAALFIYASNHNSLSNVWFEGHWGFQYYMEALGGHAVDFDRSEMHAGDWLAIPANAINTAALRREFIASQQLFEVKDLQRITTMRWSAGSGFYASFFGPLPFSVGDIRPERYFLIQVRSTAGPSAWNK